MTKQKVLTDPSSCLNKAADDEPLFVIRGNDPCAGATVRDWVRRYVMRKGGHHAMSTRECMKVDQALALANDMDTWRARRAVAS